MYFFFFKQKTAYEMRISDWSSDVCSSDLPEGPRASRRTFDRQDIHIVVHCPLQRRRKQRVAEPPTAAILADATNVGRIVAHWLGYGFNAAAHDPKVAMLEVIPGYPPISTDALTSPRSSHGRRVGKERVRTGSYRWP